MAFLTEKKNEADHWNHLHPPGSAAGEAAQEHCRKMAGDAGLVGGLRQPVPGECQQSVDHRD
jgi:hypothetical protein